MTARTLKFFDSGVVDSSEKAVGFTQGGLDDLKSELGVNAPLVIGKQHFLIPRNVLPDADITQNPSVTVNVPAGTVRVDCDIRLGLFSLGSPNVLIGFRVFIDGVDIAGYGFVQQLQGHHNPHAFRIIMDAATVGLTPGTHTLQLQPQGSNVGNVPSGSSEAIQDINIILEYLSA